MSEDKKKGPKSAIGRRNKGKQGEREVVALLQPCLDEVYGGLKLAVPRLERNLLQSSNGGYDITGLDYFALEVKRQETDAPAAVQGWWEQTCHQAKEGNREPVLFYRKNGRPWRVRCYAQLKAGGQSFGIPADMDAAHWLLYFKWKLYENIQKGVAKGA